MKLVIVIPAFNESSVILNVLNSLPKKLLKVNNTEVVVVDDGSFDETSKEVLKSNAFLIRHFLNRGVGAATKTGIEWAKKNGADVVVTFDADGQHDASDLQRLIDPVVLRKSDLVIGSRLKKRQKMPQDRFVLNWLANLATFVFFGVYSSDSQSGLRAMSRKAINLISFKSDKMEFSSEIIHEARLNNLKVTEVPIKAIYTNYSRDKGQRNSNAFTILSKFLLKIFR